MRWLGEVEGGRKSSARKTRTKFTVIVVSRTSGTVSCGCLRVYIDGLVTSFSTPFRKCVFHARTDRRTKIENLIEFLENFSSTTKKGEKKATTVFCALLLVTLFVLSSYFFYSLFVSFLQFYPQF